MTYFIEYIRYHRHAIIIIGIYFSNVTATKYINVAGSNRGKYFLRFTCIKNVAQEIMLIDCVCKINQIKNIKKDKGDHRVWPPLRM